MSRHASVSAAIAALAISLGAMSLGALAPTDTAYAATCSAAPKPAAPAGSHWYYRTERPSGRKCWYLAAEGRKGQAVPRPAATDPDEDDVAEPAAPPMAEVAARLTEPLRSPPPAAPPAADAAIVAQAAPSAPLPVLPPADAAQRSDEPAAAAVPEPVPAPQPMTAAPQPMVESPAALPASAAAPPSDRINMMQFVFVAFAGVCFVAGLFFYLAARRRRSEIRIVDLNTTASLRVPPMAALTDSPSVAPDSGRREVGEVDEPLRRFAQARKRQPA